MAKRTKKEVLTGITPQQMQEAFAAYAWADAEIQAINAANDVEIAKIRERSLPDLGMWQAQKEIAEETLEAYALENRERLFSRKKSMSTPYGVFGFRTGNPRLSPAKGFKWDTVLPLVKKLLPSYIRTSEEVAKDRLLADRNKKTVSAKLAEAGLRVVQSEVFYIEPTKGQTYEIS